VPSGVDPVRAILLDIEGTTTPADFVYRTLFPYARNQLRVFLLKHQDDPDVRSDIGGLYAQYRLDENEKLNPPVWQECRHDQDPTSAISYALWLMDRDSKCRALKSLQGQIWQQGYQRGELRGEVYPDVPPALARWTGQGKIVCIFSSGSVLAQKLLFGSTPSGDLTRFLRAYFDTAVGPKFAAASYAHIAAALALEPPKILFLSDVGKELDAAREAGMQTALSVRAGSTEPIASSHRVVHTFDELFP
jgi:enolase-phosphatase E1